jgi:hypothetical protein
MHIVLRTYCFRNVTIVSETYIQYMQLTERYTTYSLIVQSSSISRVNTANIILELLLSFLADFL